MTVLGEFMDSYRQMLDDMGGEESVGWYGWIGFGLVKRMATRIEELEAQLPPEPRPVDKLVQGYERLRMFEAIDSMRPPVAPKRYGRRSAFDTPPRD